MEVCHIAKNVKFQFTAIYGSPQVTLRKYLWSDLTNLVMNSSTPWLLAGDFNAIVHCDERKGGSERVNHGCNLFKAFIDHHSLLDLGFTGPKFTWRRGTLLVRLDRALCNPPWLNLFSTSSVDHLPKILSDHRPIMINLGFTRRHNISDKPFKFLASWLTHPHFSDLVKDNWDPDRDIISNIKSFSTAAQNWNSQTFGAIGTRKRRILSRLSGVQRHLEDYPFSDFLFELDQTLREEYEDICFQEEILWLQKSSSEWLCLGDRNTSYYHTKALVRKRRNHISKLRASQGEWVDDEEQLTHMARDYFAQLYSLDDNHFHPPAIKGAFPPISPSNFSDLNRSIAIEEVKQALLEMKPLKSPGIDGLHALFFQSQWNIVGPTLFTFVQQLWRGCPLDPSLNRTLIALIPKVNKPSYISEFRPISLCSVVYKLVTKVIANRLRVLMSHLISPYQSSFIQGRSIIDNIIIAQETIHSMRKKRGKGGWMAIKIDLEKAFDRLRWDFIEDTLKDVGLPVGIVSLIMNCITSSTMQVLWNGKPSAPFVPMRGVRQGDPLSPYIFVLCMERLSQAITAEVNKGNWKSIKLGRNGVPLSHLFFADDLIIFGHTTTPQMEVIRRTL